MGRARFARWALVSVMTLVAAHVSFGALSLLDRHETGLGAVSPVPVPLPGGFDDGLSGTDGEPSPEKVTHSRATKLGWVLLASLAMVFLALVVARVGRPLVTRRTPGHRPVPCGTASPRGPPALLLSAS